MASMRTEVLERLPTRNWAYAAFWSIGRISISIWKGYGFCEGPHLTRVKNMKMNLYDGRWEESNVWCAGGHGEWRVKDSRCLGLSPASEVPVKDCHLLFLLEGVHHQCWDIRVHSTLKGGGESRAHSSRWNVCTSWGWRGETAHHQCQVRMVLETLKLWNLIPLCRNRYLHIT